MTFNKYIFLFVLTFPFVLGAHRYFFYIKKSWILIWILVTGLSFPGFPFQPLDPKCKALQPIVTDLVDNLFNHECGEAVSFVFSLLIINTRLTLRTRSYRLTRLFVSVFMMLLEFPSRQGKHIHSLNLDECNSETKNNWLARAEELMVPSLFSIKQSCKTSGTLGLKMFSMIWALGTSNTLVICPLQTCACSQRLFLLD